MQNENRWNEVDYDKINWGKLKWPGLATFFTHTYLIHSIFLNGYSSWTIWYRRSKRYGPLHRNHLQTTLLNTPADLKTSHQITSLIDMEEAIEFHTRKAVSIIRVSVFHSGVINNSDLLGCGAASLGELFPAFRRNIVPYCHRMRSMKNGPRPL
jgi:hypothetical protein